MEDESSTYPTPRPAAMLRRPKSMHRTLKLDFNSTQWVPITLEWSLMLVIGTYVLGYFFLGFLLNPGDFEHLASYYEIAWRFWHYSGEFFPHFNPLLCGGRTLGADPQLPVFSPLVLLVPLLGSVLLVKWEILIQAFLGAWGFWSWLGLLGLAQSGKIWGVLLFISGGGVVTRFMAGHFAMGFYFLFPLFFLLSYQLDRFSGAKKNLVRAFYWLLFIYSGLYKPNFIVYGVLPLLLETALRALLSKRWGIFIEFCIGLMVCVLVNAVSYIPSGMYFAQIPRVVHSQPISVPFYTFFLNVLMPPKSLPNFVYGPFFLQRHEYSYFIGPVAFLFAIFGMQGKLWGSYQAQRISLLFFLVISLWLGFGSGTHEIKILSPYTWFYSLWPGFKSIRVPVRFWFGAYLALIVFSVVGFRTANRGRVFLVFLVLGIMPLVLNAVINLGKPILKSWHTQWSFEKAYSGDFELSVAGQSDQYRFICQGKAVILCSDNIQIFRSDQLEEKRLLDIQSGRGNLPKTWEAEWRGWSRFRVMAQGGNDFILTFNMNHSPFWGFLGKGRIVSTFGERLAVASENGEVKGEALFRQPYVIEGFYISLGGIFLFIFYWIWVLQSMRKERRG